MHLCKFVLFRRDKKMESDKKRLELKTCLKKLSYLNIIKLEKISIGTYHANHVQYKGKS